MLFIIGRSVSRERPVDKERKDIEKRKVFIDYSLKDQSLLIQDTSEISVIQRLLIIDTYLSMEKLKKGQYILCNLRYIKALC